MEGGRRCYATVFFLQTMLPTAFAGSGTPRVVCHAGRAVAVSVRRWRTDRGCEEGGGEASRLPVLTLFTKINVSFFENIILYFVSIMNNTIIINQEGKR